MATQYFTRYSDSAAWLQDDVTRGYSFNSYIFDNSAEELLAEFLGVDVDDLEDEYNVEDLIEEYNVAEHSNGKYGFALSGLCGYGPFETVEEAKANATSSYGCYSVCGIFEGREVGMDNDSTAVLFRPMALVETFDTKAVVAA